MELLGALVLALVFGDSEGRKDSRSRDVVVDRVVAFPQPQGTDVILLRNQGQNVVDLKDWWIADRRKDKRDPDAALILGKGQSCRSVSRLPPGGTLELTPRVKRNPCGFPFGVSNADALFLFDAEDERVAFVEWDWSLPGLALRRQRNGSYDYRAEDRPAAQLMQQDYPQLRHFVRALQIAREWKGLWKRSDPESVTFNFSSNDLIPFQLPGGRPRGKALRQFRKEMPQNASIFPYPGQLTVLSPNNRAMNALYRSGIFGENLTRAEIQKLPAFRQIIKFHILPGQWTTGYFLDGIQIRSALEGANHTVLHGAPQKGQHLLGTDCRRPTPKRTKCPCRSGCGRIRRPDIYAANGVFHIIDRVLLPETVARNKRVRKRVNKPSKE